MTRKRPKRRVQRGAQSHAEGEHGAVTRAFIRPQQITTHLREEDESRHPRYDPKEIAAHNTRGKDRLFEGRQQHDEADKGSEKTRLARDVDRHGHKRAGRGRS